MEIEQLVSDLVAAAQEVNRLNYELSVLKTGNPRHEGALGLAWSYATLAGAREQVLDTMVNELQLGKDPVKALKRDLTVCNALIVKLANEVAELEEKSA